MIQVKHPLPCTHPAITQCLLTVLPIPAADAAVLSAVSGAWNAAQSLRNVLLKSPELLRFPPSLQGAFTRLKDFGLAIPVVGGNLMYSKHVSLILLNGKRLGQITPSHGNTLQYTLQDTSQHFMPCLGMSSTVILGTSCQESHRDKRNMVLVWLMEPGQAISLPWFQICLGVAGSNPQKCPEVTSVKKLSSQKWAQCSATKPLLISLS